MSCKTLLSECEATQTDLAEAMGLSQSTVSRILSGSVAMKRDHVDAALRFFSRRLGRDVKYEEAFGSPRRRVRRAA